MSKITFSIGGVHPHDNKISRECALQQLPLAPTVYISVAQHIGAPSVPVVAVGDKVKWGRSLPNPAAS
jgi:electron transport complex protein RnfC